MSPDLQEAIQQLQLANLLLGERDLAERRLRKAVLDVKAEDLATEIAAVDAAYAGAWDALDRAHRELAARGREVPAFRALRDALPAVDRQRCVIDATNTISVSPTIGAGGIGMRRHGEVGATILTDGVLAARQACAALQAAVPEVDWAAAAAAARKTAPRLGVGFEARPVLIVGGIAAALLGGFIALRHLAGDGDPPPPPPPAAKAAPAQLGDDAIAALVAGEPEVIEMWLASAGRRRPDDAARVRAAAAARARDLVAAARDLDTARAAWAMATRFGEPADVRASHAALDREATRALDAGAAPVELWTTLLADGIDPFEIPGVRARLATVAREAVARDGDLATAISLHAALEPGEITEHALAVLRPRLAAARTLDELDELGETAAHTGALDPLAPELGRRAGPLLRAALAAATTLDELTALAEQAERLMPDGGEALVVARARTLVAKARTADELEAWLVSGLLDEALERKVSARLDALEGE